MSHLRGVLGFGLALGTALLIGLAAGLMSGLGIVALYDGHLPSRGDIIAIGGALVVGLVAVLVVFLTSGEAEEFDLKTNGRSIRVTLKCALAGLGALALPLALFHGRLLSVESAALAVEGMIAGAAFAQMLRVLVQWQERQPTDVCVRAD